jgi:hypothetical protein
LVGPGPAESRAALGFFDYGSRCVWETCATMSSGALRSPRYLMGLVKAIAAG